MHGTSDRVFRLPMIFMKSFFRHLTVYRSSRGCIRHTFTEPSELYSTNFRYPSFIESFCTKFKLSP